MLSASGIAIALVGFILAAYGTALGKELSDYYGYLVDRAERAENDIYQGWIVAAPALCLICNFFLALLFPMSYRAIKTRANKYTITLQ